MYEHYFITGFFEEMEKQAGLPSYMKRRMRAAKKKGLPYQPTTAYEQQRVKAHTKGREAAQKLSLKGEGPSPEDLRKATAAAQSGRVAKKKMMMVAPAPKPGGFAQSPVAQRPVAPTPPSRLGQYLAGGALALGTMGAMQSARERA